jgi:hypothetical protein
MLTPACIVTTLYRPENNVDEDPYPRMYGVIYARNGNLYCVYSNEGSEAHFAIMQVSLTGRAETLAESKYNNYWDTDFDAGNGFDYPSSLAVIDKDLYISETRKHRIRKLSF